MVKFGTPEEVFKPGYIADLFSIATGSFDEISGSMELPAAEGESKVFVIAGGGTGRMLYRRLQRRGIPFAAGILFENDLDYPTARALAAEVISTRGFEPISEEMVEIAKQRINVCEKVICCKKNFGTFELANRELVAYAGKIGKKVEFIQEG